MKAAGVGGIYAVLGFMLSLTASFVLWQAYDGSIDAWAVFVRYEKVGLQIITTLVAYLAAHSYHPSRLTAFIAAITAALLFRITELSLYAAQSVKWFAYRDGVLLTVVAALAIGMVAGFVAARKGLQHGGVRANRLQRR